MQQFNARFKHIFLPFLYLGAGWLVIYSFLHWLLVIRFPLVNLPEMVINFAIPCALIAIIFVIWLRPRLQLLKYNKGKNPMFFFIYISVIAWGIPTTFAQFYVETATGQLTHIDSISQVTALPLTKYYTVKQFYSAKKGAHVKMVFKVTGKNNVDFNMTAYTAVPLFNHLFPDTNLIAAMRKAANPKTLVLIDNKTSTMQRLAKLPADSIRFMRYINPTEVMPQYGDTGKYGALAVVTIAYHLKKNPEPQKMWPVAWLAISYSKTISNRLSPAEKDLNFKVFVAQCEADFKREPLDSLIYMDRVAPYNRDFDNYQAAVHSRNDVPDGDALLFLPVYKPFAQHNGNRLFWIFTSLSIGSAVFFVILLCFPIQTTGRPIKRVPRVRPKRAP